ncbi:MAG: phosphatidylinositol-specific phospholipase C/glycerophosphodiester phosphodiesterase family protein [Bacteroidetes bacterium]|nr:phosphatidylinositol-specific phospholipase C/glycerophosphodiester phosphodiesterase family protein [Bacteroidota bacterium]
MRYNPFSCVCLLATVCLSFAACSQQPAYTTSNAHSHNDYNNTNPFFGAYAEGFGSIEADIFLHHDSLIVGHNWADTVYHRTLDSMYLTPLAQKVAQNNGCAFKDSSLPLQIMIDLKTPGQPTLQKLVEVLQRYPALTQCKNIRFVMSGNRPPDSLYNSYPPYIWFDGVLSRSYSPAALSRIAMMSDDLKHFSKWDGSAPLPDSDYQRLKAMVQQAHSLQKKVRFWDAPDTLPAWNELERLHVDYINTDHIPGLAAYLRRL